MINNKKKKRGKLINKIIKDGVTFSDAKGIANALNSYFCELDRNCKNFQIPTNLLRTIYLPTLQKTFSYIRSLPMKLNWKYLN